eukprot:3653272-Rhodomonas_salina.1
MIMFGVKLWHGARAVTAQTSRAAMATLLAGVSREERLMTSAVPNLSNRNVTVQGAGWGRASGWCVRSGAWRARVPLPPPSSAAHP